MLRWLKRLFRRLYNPTYVMIYDFDDGSLAGEIESYYGYFATKAEARDAYGSLIATQEHMYSNARLCRVVKNIGNSELW